MAQGCLKLYSVSWPGAGVCSGGGEIRRPLIRTGRIDRMVEQYDALIAGVSWHGSRDRAWIYASARLSDGKANIQLEIESRGRGIYRSWFDWRLVGLEVVHKTYTGFNHPTAVQSLVVE
jgi:hypothetical protein